MADHDVGVTDCRPRCFKVPHHGSADYPPQFRARSRRLVSVVSSGDETREAEYIHPRATLLERARPPRARDLERR